ncbi:ABC transporter permease [Salinisphaera sp.]|uniref:ABC transporter permease n=1 Tax=Salinisphaera sp. TaxID=1914330 RepID=UPI002D79FB39|nr:ABC transporter permease [Salinisphaera sp.]HET7315040.1 ABC transporter permease [Salinisphaera sp.]
MVNLRLASRITRRPSLVCILTYIVMYGIYVGVQGHFALTAYGISVLLNNSITLAIGASAITFVILIGGFDLSLAGTVALTNSLIAVAGFNGLGGSIAAFFVVIAIGAVVGAVNGYLVAYGKLQSIAATLGTMIMTSGIALLLLNAPGGRVPDTISYGLTGQIGVVPVAAVILVIFTAILWVMLGYTRLGISLLSIGQDRTAARGAGINVERTEFFAYLLSGTLAGVCGYMVGAETGTGNPQFNTAFLLLAFASVAIGGTAFGGGRGTVLGSVVGAGLLELIQKTLFALGVSSFFTGIFEGLLMIIAVLISSLISMLAEREYAQAG